MGEPIESASEYIGCRSDTRGIETSKYPEEKKSIEIPSVVASERGRAQTGLYVTGWSRCKTGVVGCE